MIPDHEYTAFSPQLWEFTKKYDGEISSDEKCFRIFSL